MISRDSPLCRIAKEVRNDAVRLESGSPTEEAAMRMRAYLSVHLLGALLFAGTANAQQHDMSAMSDAEMIKSAMSAAPAAISKDATIISVEKDGSLRTVRKGTGPYTCMGDNPVTPGPDPMCMDPNALEWVKAWVGRKTPAADKVGLMYMLAGGTDASNTDPFAQAPTAGNHWIKTGPHIMVVGAPSLLQHYPRGADPDTSRPYVMWAGTPYEHLMAPVQ
jgi:hypothetical protein